MASRVQIYGLLCAVVLIAWAGAREPASSAAIATSSGSRANVSLQQAIPASRSIPTLLPAELERPALEPANRDPFAALAPPPPTVVIQKQVPVAPPPAPSPPPLNLRFTGRMTAPDGSQVIFVAFGDTPMSLSLGQTLPNGYRVHAIHERNVELHYQPLNFTARLDLPEPPRYEIR